MLTFRNPNFISLVILLSLTYIHCREISTTDFLLSQLLEPYDQHLTSFKTNLETSLYNPLRALLLNTFQKDLFHDDLDPCFSIQQPTTPKITTSNISKSSEKHSSKPSRLLQSLTCLNGGYNVEAYVKLYICDGQSVSKTAYDERGGVGCAIDTLEREFCYCPFDFYGGECESFNNIYCELQPVSHPLTQCTGENSHYYMYSYHQSDMPCYPVSKSKPLEMKFKTLCRNQNTRWNYEGIKIEEELDYQIIDAVSPFQEYKVNTPDLKLSFYPMFSLVLKFVNWYKVFKPYVVEIPLSPQQAAGLESINFTVDIPSIVNEYSISGRYYYELEINDGFVGYSKLTGVLENADYVEPSKPKLPSHLKYLIYAAVSLVLLILIYVVYRMRHILFKTKSRRKKSYEPLIELELSHAPHSA